MTKRLSLALTLLMFFSLSLLMQDCSATQWARTYGGGGWDSPSSIKQTTDGGFIVAGFTTSFGAGSGNYWILKLDSNGNVAWQKTYGWDGGDYAYSIQQTKDGGYIVAGRQPGNDMWILKLDQTGNVAWQKTYGGTNSAEAYSIQQTIDGGYIAAGAVGDHSGVLKLDQLGNVSWQKTYVGIRPAVATSIQQTTDGGYILTGWVGTIYVHDEMFIIKLDQSGNVSWQKTFGGYDIHCEAAPNSIQQTNDGGYIAVGDAQIIKLDQSGNVSWQKTRGPWADCAYSYPANNGW